MFFTQEYFLGFCSGSGSRFCFEVLGSVSGPEFLGLLGLGVLKAKEPHAFQKVLSLGFKSPYCYQGSYDFLGFGDHGISDLWVLDVRCPKALY